jgi:hypothetical protein
LNAKVKAPVLTYLQMLFEYWIPTTVSAAAMLPGERLIDRMADDGTRITPVMADDTLPETSLQCARPNDAVEISNEGEGNKVVEYNSRCCGC